MFSDTTAEVISTITYYLNEFKKTDVELNSWYSNYKDLDPDNPDNENLFILRAHLLVKYDAIREAIRQMEERLLPSLLTINMLTENVKRTINQSELLKAG